MERQKKEKYLENISHITKSRPYSIHESGFSSREDSALYLHWHPEAEFCYLQEGELEFNIEDVRYSLRAGDAVFIPPNLLHTASCAEGTGIFRAFVFSTDMIALPGETVQFKKYVQPMLLSHVGFCLCMTPETGWQREALSCLKRIFDCAAREGEKELIIGGLTLILWQYLYNHHISAVAGGWREEGPGPRLYETLRYIHEHYADDISLKALADTAHVSESQLCRSFRQFTGTTPFSYLKRQRILHSCDYLTGTEKKISEICTLCGFNNISYYNREFLKTMKETPSAYRIRSRGG